ncbi:unnamed protein product [Alopecurus aequalis]
MPFSPRLWRLSTPPNKSRGSPCAWRAPASAATIRSMPSFLHHDDTDDRVWSTERSAVTVMLSHRAARRVEELRVYMLAAKGELFCAGVYKLVLDSLPWETIRVLELTLCKGLHLPVSAAAVVLPRLSSLRQAHCAQGLHDIQAIINAAPALATLRLECLVLEPREDAPPECHKAWDWGDDAPPASGKEAVPHRLQCPMATVLVLERWTWESYNDGKPSVLNAVEIDAPRLRRFKYKGLLRQFSFSPRPQDLERVDLHFFPDYDTNRRKDPCRDLQTFWQFVRSFTSTKEMKLRLKNVEDMAVLSEARRVELLPSFCWLERLEVQGVHRLKGKTAAVAITNLLRSCPILRDFRINITAVHHKASKGYDYAHEFLERKYTSDRDKSIDRLNQCSHSELSTIFPQGYEDGVNYDEVSEIPGLSGRSFQCLQSSLRKVGLRFRLEGSNCLGVKLVKFFAENAMVLEEMHIDSGNRKLREHMNRKVETWMANSANRRKSGAPSFVVLPLEG